MNIWLVALIIGALSLSTVPAFAQYSINEEQAGQLVDDIKDKGVPLAKEGFSFAHSVIYRIVSIFLPEHPMLTPELVSTITIVLTIVGIVGIGAKIGSHSQKVVVIVMLLGLMMFLVWPAGGA